MARDPGGPTATVPQSVSNGADAATALQGHMARRSRRFAAFQKSPTRVPKGNPRAVRPRRPAMASRGIRKDLLGLATAPRLPSRHPRDPSHPRAKGREVDGACAIGAAAIGIDGQEV